MARCVSTPIWSQILHISLSAALGCALYSTFSAGRVAHESLQRGLLHVQVIKRLVNESRPVNARAVDPGMPSSHASSLAFFGSYIVLSLTVATGPSAVPVGSAYAVTAITLCMVRSIIYVTRNKWRRCAVLYGMRLASQE